jgi:tRNA pseudouridine13 synthase
LRKDGWTTLAAAEVLSRWAGVSVRQVGFAGQKDRHAVTEQWFSIQLPGRPDPNIDWDWPAGLEITKRARHDRKLRRGALLGNHFQITIRECSGEREKIDQRLKMIALNGVPNYFTEQRFGRAGENVQRAKDFFAGRYHPARSSRSMLISAARSSVFNQILAARVRDKSWNQPQRGDLMMLSGSHSVFLIEDVDAEITQRVRQGDLHPSGSLPGETGKLVVEGAVRELEDRVACQQPELMQGLIKQRVKAARRSLRVIPEGLGSLWLDDTTLKLDFALPAGSYATAVLRELFEYTDMSRQRRNKT